MQNFTLHIISHPVPFDGEIEAVEELMLSNQVYFHWRKPDMDDSAYEELLRQLPEALFERIFLHSAYHLANEFEFAGLHFSTPKRNIANNIESSMFKSTSCHSLEKLIDLKSDFKQFFLSPVFDSISKQGYRAGFHPKELSDFLKIKRKTKIIALGGIAAGNITKVKEMGFDGAAVLGAVWGNNPKRGDDFNACLQTILSAMSR